MDWVPLAEDPLLAILPPEYDLRGRDRFNVEDFAGQEFLMPSLGFHLDILRALNRSNVTPVIRTTQVSDSVIISMVEHGLGVSVLSELVLKGRRDDVQAVPLDPPAYRQLGILVRDRKDLRPAARRFAPLLRRVRLSPVRIFHRDKAHVEPVPAALLRPGGGMPHCPQPGRRRVGIRLSGAGPRRRRGCRPDSH